MNIIRAYNQNRRTVWIIIIAFIFLFCVLRGLNAISEKKNNEEYQNYLNDLQTPKEEDYKDNPDIKVTISDEKVEEKKELIIDQFIRYCNAKNINEAYNLLSENCKKYVYPTKDIFEKNYVNKIYNTTKLYSKEYYFSGTYKVKLYEDMTSTGKVSDMSIEDYFTIDESETYPKLNISGYIKNEKYDNDIENGSGNSYVKINVTNRAVFRDYEEYTIEIKNLTNKDIRIDSLEDTRSTYMTDTHGVKYYAMLHEKTQDDLIVPNGAKKIVVLKFNKVYGKNSNIKSITFSDIILDNKKYSSSNNKYEYEDRTNITTNI